MGTAATEVRDGVPVSKPCGQHNRERMCFLFVARFLMNIYQRHNALLNRSSSDEDEILSSSGAISEVSISRSQSPVGPGSSRVSDEEALEHLPDDSSAVLLGDDTSIT